MERLEIEATTENLYSVLNFIDEKLEEYECSMKAQMQIDIAVEEIFVNIANYAYDKEAPGTAQITIELMQDNMLNITFTDSGIPYDPLAKDDPDVTLNVEERPIGGLGIFMVKKSMDDMQYRYEDGHNILTLIKKIA